MKRRTGKMLGVTIGQKGLLLAEVSSKGDSCAVSRTGEMAYPEGVSLEKPAELGAALRQFLKAEDFSTREAVIGLPAKRLMTRRKDVPPAAPATASSMLRLQAESEFSSEPEGLVMDFAGETSATEASTVLVIAATRDCITQCEAMAKAAGLKLRGITASGAALGRATSRVPGGDGLVVSLAPGGSELVVQHGDSPSQLRHLNIGDSVSAEAMGLLVGEIRRTMASMPRNGTPMRLALWNSPVEGGNGAGSLLEERLSMPVTTPDLRKLATTETTGDEKYAPAVAVALVGLETGRLPVDFMDSRLAPPPPESNRRKMVWGIALAVTAAIVVVSCWWSLHANEQKLASEKEWLASHKEVVQEGQTALNQLNTARNWSPGKPRTVSCLRDLTNLFTDDATIWATTLSLHPNSTGELQGKAQTQQDVLKLLDRMKQSHAFEGAKWTDLRNSSDRGQGTEAVFTITFTYHPAE